MQSICFAKRIDYYDCLMVSVGAGNGSYLITRVVPDFLDCQDARSYLPHPTATSTTTNPNVGSFRSDALTAQQTYYNGQYVNGAKTCAET